MEKTNTPVFNFKKILDLFFQSQKQETVAVQEWTPTHFEYNDPRFSFLESRMASLEGGVSALAVKSLRSARFKVIQSLLEKGDNVVTFNSWSLALEDKEIYNRSGIEIRIPSGRTIQDFHSIIDPKTKLIYLETIDSHSIAVPDFIKIISYAQLFKIPVVVDNTASVGSYLFEPFRLKANLIIDSLEDYLPKSTRKKAVIIDGGNFNWFGGKFRKLNGENVKFTSLADGKEINPAEKKSLHLVDYLRRQASNGHNGYPIPHDPFSLVKKLEEIPEKLQLRSDNATKLTGLLKNSKYVSSVNHTSQPKGTGYFEALKFFKNGFGHYLSFTLNVNEEAAEFLFKELQSHPAYKHRLTYNVNKKQGYIAAPAVEFSELKDNLEESLIKLRDFLDLQYSSSRPWLALVELD